ncbi:MAG: DNA polymerase III subunit beta [Phycisphaerales bacterium]|nr:DNA polymerase III subunit beta [Phycisphaerales bacterium]
MKVQLNRQEFAEALAAVGSVAAQRTPKPILQCVLLDVQGDHCVVAATDLEIGIRYTLTQVDVDKKGKVVLPADKLGQIVRESGDDVLALESDDSVCHVRGQGAHYQIYAQDPADFPPVSDLEGTPDFEVDGALLRRMAEWTVFAAARENTRYAINGVLWEKDGQNLSLVATDGRRLSLARGVLAGAEGPNMERIVPVKAMALIQKIIGDARSPLGIKLTGNQVIVKGARATVSSGLVEGQFPKYSDVIPSEHDRTVVIKTSEFHSAVRRAALLTNEESKGVRLAFKKNQLTLSSRAPSQGEATIDIPVTMEGPDIEIGFNPYFLIEALKNVQKDEVSVELKDSNRPGVLKTDSDFVYVVMPVNLS